MEGMPIFEINDTNPNNVRETYSVPDNEKNNKERNIVGDEGTNLETASKRKSLPKTAILLLSVGSAALLGGGFLINAFLGQDPTASDISFQKTEEGLSYSFKLDGIKNLSVLFLVKEKEETLHEETFQKNGVYRGLLPILADNELNITLRSTNGFDYEKILFETEI